MANLKLNYYSDVKNGKLQDNVRNMIAKELIHFEGKRVEITIEKVSYKRSVDQNKYYWGCVVLFQIDCFKQFWGEVFTKEQIHIWNKANVFCTEKIIESTGEIIKIPGSSTDETSGSFEDKMELIRQFFWKSFDFKIPLPNENIKFDLE